MGIFFSVTEQYPEVFPEGVFNSIFGFVYDSQRKGFPDIYMTVIAFLGSNRICKKIYHYDIVLYVKTPLYNFSFSFSLFLSWSYVPSSHRLRTA